MQWADKTGRMRHQWIFFFGNMHQWNWKFIRIAKLAMYIFSENMTTERRLPHIIWDRKNIHPHFCQKFHLCKSLVPHRDLQSRRKIITQNHNEYIQMRLSYATYLNDHCLPKAVPALLCQEKYLTTLSTRIQLSSIDLHYRAKYFWHLTKI